MELKWLQIESQYHSNEIEIEMCGELTWCWLRWHEKRWHVVEATFRLRENRRVGGAVVDDWHVVGVRPHPSMFYGGMVQLIICPVVKYFNPQDAPSSEIHTVRLASRISVDKEPRINNRRVVDSGFHLILPFFVRPREIWLDHQLFVHFEHFTNPMDLQG